MPSQSGQINGISAEASIPTVRFSGAVPGAAVNAGIAKEPPAGVSSAPSVSKDIPIGPATADHMVRGLEQAESEGAPLVILRIDTPGGLDLAMRAYLFKGPGRGALRRQTVRCSSANHLVKAEAGLVTDAQEISREGIAPGLRQFRG